MLPTFRWDRKDEGSKRTHVRHGKAVRVWLRRPWFSSGDGELLGVVLEPATRLPLGWLTTPQALAAGTVRAGGSNKKRSQGLAPRNAGGALERAGAELRAADA